MPPMSQPVEATPPTPPTPAPGPPDVPTPTAASTPATGAPTSSADPSPAPVPPSSPSSSGDADGDPWTQVLEGVRKKKPAIQGFLRGAEAVLEGDASLRIEIPAGQSIYLDLLQSKDNRRLLVELVQECYGRPLALRFEAVARAVPPKPVAREAEVEEGAGKAGIQRIVDIFDGDVLGPS